MIFGSKSIPFNPQKDIPSLEGKVILITGGNIGLGKQCVLEYARHKPALIWLAARNTEKAQAAADEVRQEVPDAAIKLLEMDLSSLESVATAARTVTADSDRLDILMLNAGVMAAPPGLTQDGYELQFGTNYVGHALLFKLLVPVLQKTTALPDADVRVIVVSSHALVYAPKQGVVFDSLRSDADNLGAYGRYGQSKLAMVLWTRELGRKYPQFTLASIHPGVVQTNLFSGATGSPMIIRVLAKVATSTCLLTPVDQGARNQLWASVSNDVKSGEYYEPVGIAGPASPLAGDDALAEKVWDWTEKELERFSV